MLCGGSSGAVLMAVDMVKHRIPRNANCVAIFPDRGERYLDTIYSRPWVLEHFGILDETDEVQSPEELLVAGSRS